MWLYMPTTSPSVPVEEDSTSPSNWRFQALAQSCWWRGKRSRAPIWLQRCKRMPSIRLLSGAMCDPSTADHGAALWMASLAESRASLTQQPDAREDSTTSAISGRQPGASSPAPARGSSSSRTSAECSRRGLTKSLEPSGFGETYASWVTRLRQDCSRRRKLARAMNASASSFSASVWLTPNVPNGGRALAADVSPTGMKPDGGKAQVVLEHQARMWPTPVASDDQKTPEAHLAMKARMPGGPRHTITSLNVLVQQWPSPQARDHKGANQSTLFDRSGKMPPLNEVATLWRAPQAMDSDRGSNGTWQPKPKAGEHSLRHQVEKWKSPRTVQGGYTRDRGDPSKVRLSIDGQASAISLLHPEMATAGAPSPSTLLTAYRRYRATTDSALRSERRAMLLMAIRSAGRGWTRKAPSVFVRPSFRKSLNPRFVAWLMGWPMPALTGCGFSETGWCPSKPDSPSEHSQNDSPIEDTPIYGHSARSEVVPELHDSVSQESSPELRMVGPRKVLLGAVYASRESASAETLPHLRSGVQVAPRANARPDILLDRVREPLSGNQPCDDALCSRQGGERSSHDNAASDYREGERPPTPPKRSGSPSGRKQTEQSACQSGGDDAGGSRAAPSPTAKADDDRLRDLRDDIHASQDKARQNHDLFAGMQKRAPARALAGPPGEGLREWKAHMRSALLALGLPPAALPAQTDLFA